MRAPLRIGLVSLLALAGCGLEGVFSNAGRSPYERPASTLRGSVSFTDALSLDQLAVLAPTALDGSKTVEPFQAAVTGPSFELRLPSAKYGFPRVRARFANLELRALVPEVGEETAVAGIVLDERAITEALITEAWLSGNAKTFGQLSPGAYVGDGATSGTRTQIRYDMDQAGTPANALLAMVGRIVTRFNPSSAATAPDFFRIPVVTVTGDVWTVTTSPLASGWLQQQPLDYDGDGVAESGTTDFDAKLVEAAKGYAVAGCEDPTRIKVLFTVDFAAGCLDGNGAQVDRFKWAVDATDKKMFFVGWIHRESPVQDPRLDQSIGAGTPNQLVMYDDGTNGDEIAGDAIWTIAFDIPPTTRVGYKYTWGTKGAPWTGSEEWPGNSRILEIVDRNADLFVYRRDVFGDEATNKDKVNLNGVLAGNEITWTTDIRGCGPEAQEQKFVLHDAKPCGTEWHTPTSVGPIAKACPLVP